MFKKIISVLLALVLACGICLPVIAENGVVEMKMYTMYNPISNAGVIASDKYLSSETVRVPYNADIPTFDTLEDGAEYLCQRLKARDTDIQFIIKDLDGFSSLSDDDKAVFTVALVYYSMTHTGDPKGGDYIHGQWNRIGYGYAVRSNGVQFKYTAEYYASAEQEAELDVKIKEVLDELDVYDATDYEKSNAVYDYLCQNITYDYANLDDETYLLKFSAYAGLINGTCVCNGYAVLYYRMMLELGVDARYITGYGNGGLHAWNIVRLDGLYYNLDSTWDAGDTYYSYYLVPDSLFYYHEREAPYNEEDFYEIYPMDTKVYSSTAKDYVDYENGITYYPLSDDSGYMLISVSGLDREEITIPATFNGKPVIAIMNHAFLNGKNLKKITIPQSVEYIFEYAFTGCDNLETVNYLSTEENWANVYKEDTWIYSYPMPDFDITFEAPFGDINSDGKLTYNDVSKLYAIFRELAEAGDVDLDINGDGKFSYGDVSKLYAIYRES